MTWIAQYYFSDVGLPLQYFGVVWSLLVLCLIPTSFLAHRIENWFGKKNSLYIMMAFPVIGYFLLSFVQSIWGILFLVLFYFARGF